MLRTSYLNSNIMTSEKQGENNIHDINHIEGVF